VRASKEYGKMTPTDRRSRTLTTHEPTVTAETATTTWIATFCLILMQKTSLALISAFPHRLCFSSSSKVEAKVTTMTAKITKAASIANTAKNEKQEKIMKAGRAGPFHIREDKSMHRLTVSAKQCKGDRDDDILGCLCGLSRVGGEVSRQIFGRVMRVRTGSSGEVCIVCRLNNP
jgi:hypothetical protein